MFCPQCATPNDLNQRFCRQCGQLLTTIRLSLDGHIDESITKFKKSGDSLIGGLIIFGIFFLIATIVFTFGGVWPAVFDIVLGLIISLPFFITGIRRHHSAVQTLESGEKSKQLAKEKPERLGEPLRSVVTTDLIEQPDKIATSVTEHTTVKLKRPEVKE